MHLVQYGILGSSLLALANAAQVQGNCTHSDTGLKWLASVLSPDATISCRGQSGQLFNANRYWGLQYGRNASVVVFPQNAKDVSYAVQATQKTPLGANYAFVSGGHTMTNSSSSDGFVIDLTYLNQTRVVHNFTTSVNGTASNLTAIAYGGGTTTLQFETALNGTGYTGVSARVGSVGMGGFSTGGGIGFLAGAFGYATDRLIALEVVLPNGKIVFATEDNKYRDLLFAFKGAGLGQFGIVTTFYQKAAPTPKTVALGFHIMANDTTNIQRSFENTVEFFNTHQDPFSLMYYAFAYLPTDLSNPNPKPTDFALQNIVATVYFDDPAAAGGQQLGYNETFAPLLSGLTSAHNIQYTLPYANLSIVGESFFPYGFRRGFYGPQTTNVSVEYIQKATDEFTAYVNDVQAAGDFPGSSTWVLQYMQPGLNGNLPASDSDTAWPHSVAGHQTLFDPGWALSATDDITDDSNDAFNDITYEQQASVFGSAYGGRYGQNATDDGAVCGGLKLCDYPNYISPHVDGRQVWGANIPRLIAIKQKYDPNCTLHTGRVFASKGCIRKGVANVYP